MVKVPLLEALLVGLVLACTVNAGIEKIEIDPGHVIFDPSKDGYAYRYGPSIITGEDGVIDIWFASPGGPGSDGVAQWDWIRHKRSIDGGKTWGPESVVLKATEGSLDKLSVCDPGVFRMGAYYYLGVTAVDNPEGFRNQIFVARAKNPIGPFEKWNGTGWGGNQPAPIVRFTTPEKAWGAGEPSFVVEDKTIFVYYTWWVTDSPDGKLLSQIRVATAPADDPNWPAKLKYRGVAYNRLPGEDSVDVKYVDSAGVFLGVATATRMSPEAHVVYRTSVDGIHWTSARHLRKNIMPWCHNAGVSGDGLGHIDSRKEQYLGYAFSMDPKVNWAFWHTMLHPIKVVPETAK